VDPADRAVGSPDATVAWGPAQAADLAGTWRATHVEGAAAPSLLSLTYHFGSDGTYSAAALVASHPPAFQVRKGRWHLAGGTLDLGDGSEAARLEEAPDHLRLTTSQGRVVLAHDEMR
jgi:hypothetical protein